jgi:hypothetical protein
MKESSHDWPLAGPPAGAKLDLPFCSPCVRWSGPSLLHLRLSAPAVMLASSSAVSPQGSSGDSVSEQARAGGEPAALVLGPPGSQGPRSGPQEAAEASAIGFWGRLGGRGAECKGEMGSVSSWKGLFRASG